MPANATPTMLDIATEFAPKFAAVTADGFGCEAVVCARTGTVLMAGLNRGNGTRWAKARGYSLVAGAIEIPTRTEIRQAGAESS